MFVAAGNAGVSYFFDLLAIIVICAAILVYVRSTDMSLLAEDEKETTEQLQRQHTTRFRRSGVTATSAASHARTASTQQRVHRHQLSEARGDIAAVLGLDIATGARFDDGRFDLRRGSSGASLIASEDEQSAADAKDGKDESTRRSMMASADAKQTAKQGMMSRVVGRGQLLAQQQTHMLVTQQIKIIIGFMQIGASFIILACVTDGLIVQRRR